MSQFTFPKANFSRNPPPSPEQNPLRHLLPPEPILPKTQRKENTQSLPFSEQTSRNDYEDVTLGNSPQFPQSLDAHRPIKSISNFNKKLGDSYKKVIIPGLHQSSVEILIIPEGNSRSRSKQMNSSGLRQDRLQGPKNNNYFMGLTDPKSIRQRQSRVSKNTYQQVISRNTYQQGPSKNTYQQGPSKNTYQQGGSKYTQEEMQSIRYGNSLRNPRADNLFPGEQIKNKFTTRTANKEKTASPDKKRMIETVEEYMLRIVDLQNTNKTLMAQLQIARQKLRVRQSQNTLLRNKNSQYENNFEQSIRNAQKKDKLQKELIQLKNANQAYLQEIQYLKEQIVINEQKKQQSMKLLQKLNENVSKRQQKLQRQLQDQININNKLITERTQKDQLLNNALYKIKELQDLCSLYVNQIERLTLIARQKSQLDIKLRDLSKSFTQSQEKLANALNQINKKKQQCNQMSQMIDYLKKQRIKDQQKCQQQKQKLKKDYQFIKQELTFKIKAKDQEQEQLIYKSKQFEVKVEVTEQQNVKNNQQIKDLKDQKKMLYRDKEQIKNECNQLAKKNDALFKAIEASKQTQIQLNDVILNYQKEVIGLVQTINQHITTIGNNEAQLNRLRQLLKKEKENNEAELNRLRQFMKKDKADYQSMNQKLNQQILGKDNRIANLQEKQKKLQQNFKKQQKISAVYKQGLDRLLGRKEVEWENTQKMHKEQIQKYKQKNIQLIDYKQSKNRLLNNRKETKSQARQHLLQASSRRVNQGNNI